MSVFERSYDIIQYDTTFYKSNTSNLYILDIFPDDMSGELLPAIGSR